MHTAAADSTLRVSPLPSQTRTPSHTIDTTMHAAPHPERDERPGLAALISELRSRSSLSLNDVAVRVRRAASREGTGACGVTRHTVHKWERGTVPRPDSLRWLAAALEVPVEALVSAAQDCHHHGGEDGGHESVKRRRFLQTSAALAGT